MEISHIPMTIKIYPKIVDFFTVLCGLILFGASVNQIGADWWQEVAIFALLSFVAQLAPPRLPQGYGFSVAFVLDLIVIVLYGAPVAAVTRGTVALLAGVFIKFFGRGDSFRNIIQASAEGTLIVGLAGIFYRPQWGPLAAFTAATLAYFYANTFFAAFYGLATNKENFLTSWISVIRSLFIYFLILSPLAYLLTSMIGDISLQWKIFGVMLFFVPVLLVSHALKLYFNIKQNYLNTVKTMVRAIEAKDPYMKGHSEHVAELTLAMAREIGVKAKELHYLEYVVLLHDAGKIGVSEKILNKPGPLSDEEYQDIQKHSALSAEIIGKINFLSGKSDIVRYHHERYDGMGYPEGLKGEDIPLASRILAIADAYDAMTTDRPFRSAISPAEAVRQIEELAGRQFDPALVRRFRGVLKRLGEL